MSVKTTDIDKGRIFLKTQLSDSIGGWSVLAGIFPGKDPNHEEGIAHSMAVWELGKKKKIKTPKRWPWMSNVIDNEGKKYDKFLRKMLFEIVRRRQTVKGSLTKLGIMISNDLKTSVREISEPALEPSTIEQKGSSSPLMDTGTARNAITSDLVRGV